MFYIFKDSKGELQIAPWHGAGGTKPIMECGHSANAHTTIPANPDDSDQLAWCKEHDGDKIPIHSCAICGCKVATRMPDLQGRIAKCSCGKEKESSVDLAFFEFKGVGSHRAENICKHCGYHLIPHTNGKITDHEFEPHGPFEFDEYYCGCQGWD